jgi:hypothetical protein
MAERGRRGAEATKKRWQGQVLNESELPPLHHDLLQPPRWAHQGGRT